MEIEQEITAKETNAILPVFILNNVIWMFGLLWSHICLSWSITLLMHEVVKEQRGKKLPSRSASQTSSIVTFNARRRIAKFCDFFGSIICINWGEGSWDEDSFLCSVLLLSVAAYPNRDSIIFSSNLENRNFVKSENNISNDGQEKKKKLCNLLEGS